MLRIAICDDNENDLLSVHSCVDDYFKSKKFEYSIDVFRTSSTILDQYKFYDIIYLDIELNGENGIEVAKKLRKNNNATKIILVTNSESYMLDGYKVKAERYFIKPLDRREFQIEMDDILKEYIKNNDFIYDETNARNKVFLKDIYYIEIMARKTYIYTKDNVYMSSICLSEWIKKLENKNFVQVHKSFLVNLQNIQKVEKNVILFDNEKFIYISRFYKQQFYQKYDYYALSTL